MDEARVRRIVGRWVERPALRPLAGGMNSAAWLVEAADGSRYVVKVSGRSGLAGLRVAEMLRRRGFRAGAPAQTTVEDGALVALLRYVGGQPLGSDDAELVGGTLGRVHALLAGERAPAGLARWPWRWLDPSAIVDPELRDRAHAAIERAAALAPSLTHGVLHGDPAPDAFRADGADVGLIDWGSALHGPLLYDVASACMYAGRNVLTGYAATGPLAADELGHVERFLACRWAVQAWYFSERLAANDLTGIADARENEKGLADARAALLGRDG